MPHKLPADGAERWRDSRNVLICCHDAGGAEILSEWVLAVTGKNYRFFLQGPAVAVFRRKLPDLVVLEVADAHACLPAMDFLLTGTSWASAMELDCLARARVAQVFSAAYLDHWVNYGTRFNAGGVNIFPDEIWTGDAEAYALARLTFPGHVVRVQPNPYFEKIRRDFADLPPQTHAANEVRLLYVCEPIAIDCAAVTMTRVDLGYTEFDALALCLDRVGALVPPDGSAKIRLRLHPSEKFGKYEPVLTRYRNRLAIDVSAGTTLLEDSHWATDVIGCGSMAMIVALLGGRRVYSSIPLAGVSCPLPSKAIRYLRDVASVPH